LSADPHCTWTGVSCNNSGFVVGLDLSSFGLTGLLPADIGCLPFLQYWQMIDAGLTGDLPVCMCTMEFLQYAYLSFNMITGEIPTCVNQMTYLRELHLDCNLLEGPVPVEFDELQFLEELWVQCNFDLICTELTGDFIYICGSDLPECEACPLEPVQCPICVEIEDCGLYCQVDEMPAGA
ncbi:hypothetical protein KIPB_011506, partial [Kipferlia bialata]